MSEKQPGQEPMYGEETDQEPQYPMDGGTASAEEGRDESHESDDSLANPDLHGAAREVAEDASGDGAAKTPGA